jgi:spore maturation protein SpmA
MLDVIWPLLIAAALVCGAFSGRLDAVSAAVGESARAAVDVAVGLLGMMVLWLGLVRVLEAAGFLASLARLLRPVLRRLFPDVPADHPAMSLMILNISANMLGLGNAATPFGLKAMTELERLNPQPGVATNAMVLFLAINTANVQIIPHEILALRASLGSTAPGSVILPILLATLLSTTVAIVSAKLLVPFFPLPVKDLPISPAAALTSDATPAVEAAPALAPPPASPLRRALGLASAALVIAALAYAIWRHAHGLDSSEGAAVGWKESLRVAGAVWLLPLIVAVVALAGLARGVAVYAHAVEGGREAFDVTLRILPYLVAMLVATGMLRASGAFDLLLSGVGPLASLLHIPPEAIPLGLLRSLSGSGGRGLAVEVMRMHGPDSFLGNLASVIQGSTETTFYVIAVYFGAVRVKAMRHTLAACLLSDVVGVLASVWACRLLL